MDKFLIFTIVGLSTAAIYAIIASGLVVTYTTTGIFNFAHGATGMLAAFVYWQLTVKWHWPILIAIPFVLLVMAPLFGMLLDRVIMRGLEGTSEATKLVVSISLLVAMIGLAQWIWDPSKARTVKQFFPGEKIHLGPTVVTYHQAITSGWRSWSPSACGCCSIARAWELPCARSSTTEPWLVSTAPEPAPSRSSAGPSARRWPPSVAFSSSRRPD